MLQESRRRKERKIEFERFFAHIKGSKFVPSFFFLFERQYNKWQYFLRSIATRYLSIRNVRIFVIVCNLKKFPSFAIDTNDTIEIFLDRLEIGQQGSRPQGIRVSRLGRCNACFWGGLKDSRNVEPQLAPAYRGVLSRFLIDKWRLDR